MRDDNSMDFNDVAAVIDGLFGDAVDPRAVYDEISKMNPDPSAVHVNSAGKKKEKETPKWQKNVAFGTNAAGAVAGPAAIAMAVRSAKNREGGIPREGMKLISRSKKFPKTAARANKAAKFLATNKKAAIAAGSTGVALQGANWAGDAISAKSFAPKRDKDKVKKALDSIVAARRSGKISTETAIRLSSELVEKMDKTGFKEVNEHAEVLVDHPLLPKKAKIGLKAVNAANSAASNTKTKAKTTAAKAKAVKAVVQDDNIGKSAPSLTWTGEISKFDTDKRQVFGWCSITAIDGEPVVDLQGDYVPLEEIEKAAYTYVVDSRKGGDMHKRDGENPLHTSDLVESFVVTPEKLTKMGLPSDALPHGWWVGFKVNDDKQWEMVKNGERTGFSIHGAGRRIEKML